MSKTIVISNQKGGVGKTTSVINLSSALGKRDKKILIIDMDPQGNIASGLNLKKNEVPTVYDLIIEEEHPDKVIQKTNFENVDVMVSNQDLSGAQVELVGMIARESRLKEKMQKITKNYDFIFIDTPPSLGLLTLNSLNAADSVFIPIQCEYYALEGISQLLKTIKLIKQSLNPDLFIEGVCLTMFDNRTNLSKEVMENVVSHFKEKTYKTIIPRNIKISEAPSHGDPINLYWPESIGAKSYENLADEFLEKNKKV